MIMIAGGINIVMIRMANQTSRPGKRSLANANPVIEAESSDPNSAAAVMKMVLASGPGNGTRFQVSG